MEGKDNWVNLKIFEVLFVWKKNAIQSQSQEIKERMEIRKREIKQRTSSRKHSQNI